MAKVGEFWPVWWNTGREKVNGFYPARIEAVEPYTGRYKEWFTHVLILECPSTKNGALPMTVDLRSETSIQLAGKE